MFFSTFFLFFFIIVVCNFQHHYAAGKQSCDVQVPVVSPQEKLQYLVSYNWFLVNTDVGHVTIELNPVEYKNSRLLHIGARGQSAITNPGFSGIIFIELIFKLLR